MSAPSSSALQLLSKNIGFIDIIGHSGIADANGVTSLDYGPAHKIDQFLQPAIYRSIAKGSAIHSYHEQGNGAIGDGGWARVAQEYDRQEMVSGYGATTTTAGPAAGATTVAVTQRALFQPLEWIILGNGTNTEIVQIDGGYVAAQGAGNLTLNAATPVANAGHATGEPVYHAIRNAGYLAKSSLVVLDTGGNDVPILGPVTQGTFGTNAGASRGLVPLQNAVRFTIAQMRCAVIYQPAHPINVYSGTWSLAGPSPATWSYSPQWCFGAQFRYAQAAGASVQMSTAPDFPGGTVNFFSMAYDNPSGAGALWDLTVTGATTRTSTAAFDTRNTNAVTQNDAAGQTTAKKTASVFRITGLNPGVNTITMTVNAVSTYAIHLGWGIEAQNPPLTLVPLQYRLGGFGTGAGYGLWTAATYGYVRRAPTTTQTATVSAGAGTAAGSVTLGTAVTIGTTATGNTAVYAGDTITLDVGTANEETRRVVAVDSTTTLHVDANFVNAHTAAACIIGLQDADFVGGGWRNTADTQGATSVPGLNGALQSVVNEFDSLVLADNFDKYVNPPGAGTANTGGTNGNLANDLVHLSDQGAGNVAAGALKRIFRSGWALEKMALGTVPNKRSWLPVYGDSYPTGQPAPSSLAQFTGSWQNYWPFNTANPRTGFYKDARTRVVYLRGCITCLAALTESSFPAAAFSVPGGYKPAPNNFIPIFGWGPNGPALLEIAPNGFVYVTAGFGPQSAPAAGVAYNYIEFYGSWLAEQ